MSRFSLPFLLFLCLTSLIQPSHLFAQEKKKILVLHSYHKGLGWTDSITTGIKDTFASSSIPVELHYEFMDTKRMFDRTHLANLVATYRHKYRNISFDAIISSDDHAFRFLLANSESLFPETPVVFCGVNGFKPELIENKKWFTGVVESLSFAQTLEAAYRVFPDTRQIYAVVDDTVTGHSNKKQLLDAMQQLQKKPEVIFLDKKTMAEMKESTAQLPEDSILVYLCFTTDNAGKHFSLEEGAAMINQTANSPMFSFWDFHLGHGVLGGKMTHGFTQGETASNLVLRILSGEPPSTIPVIEESPNQYIFDYTVMDRFNIDPANLPADSTILNRPKTFLEQNSGLLWKFFLVVLFLVLVIVVISYNFIKLRITDQSLKISKERFREITELLPETIYEIDMEMRCTFLNKSGKEQFQITDEDLNQGISFYSLFAPQERKTLDKRFHLLLAGKSPGLQEYSGIRRDGREFPLIARSMAIVQDGEMVGIRGILIDISEKKQLEDQIHTAQRMESVGTLAGGIAHDFNNLLMGIQGRTSLALITAEQDTQLAGHLNGIEDCVKSAANLTKQLLGFARAGKYDLKPTDLNKLIHKTTEMFGRTRKELQIKHHLQDDIWAVEADRSQIEQVLLNLLINSWQAMAGTGTISITTENIVLTADEGRIFSVNGGPYVRITVSDTGCGISQEIKEKIFEPFFTTKERGRGTGLGLASSYGIIKNHKGSIHVVSPNGEGATFQISLPARMVSIADESLQDQELFNGSETILLVDDEAMVREVTQDLLTQLGYSVLTTDSGRKALQIVQENRIDLVILDMIMPDMTGEETFRKLKQITPAIRVLLCSGYSADGQAAALINEGCNSFIQKPFNLQSLSVKVREVLVQEC